MATIQEPSNAVPKMPQVVTIYAQEDIRSEEVKGADGKITAVSKIIHAKGFAQQLPPAVAREVVREGQGRYAFEPPAGMPALTDAVGAAALQAKEADDKFRNAMEDPVLMARIRAAIEGRDNPQGAPLTDLEKVLAGQPAQVPAKPTAFDLRTLPGVDDKLARAMEDAKLGTLAALQGTTVEKLGEVPGMGGKLATKVLGYINENFPKGV